MKAALLCVLCVGVVLGLSKPRKECVLDSRDENGNPAFCGGVVGAQCPNPTDTCTFYPGADYGPCCLGCKYGYPLPFFRCGGWVHPACPWGYQCVYDPFIADLPGICCPRGHKFTHNRVYHRGR